MYITVGSITTAARLKKLLERNSGRPAAVVHTPFEINKRGSCSYSVHADTTALPLIKAICSDYGIRIKAIYIEDYKDGERVFREVS